MNSQSDGDGQAALTVRDITQHHVVSLTKLSFLCLLYLTVTQLQCTLCPEKRWTPK